MSEAKQAIGPNQEKWLQALESGEYEQGVGFLLCTGKYCCLGVGCELSGASKDGTDNSRLAHSFDDEYRKAPQRTVDWLGLKSPWGFFGGHDHLDCKDGFRAGDLADANDHETTFPEIAAFCRENPSIVFTEPR